MSIETIDKGDMIINDERNMITNDKDITIIADENSSINKATGGYYRLLIGMQMKFYQFTLSFPHVETGPISKKGSKYSLFGFLFCLWLVPLIGGPCSLFSTADEIFVDALVVVQISYFLAFASYTGARFTTDFVTFFRADKLRNILRKIYLLDLINLEKSANSQTSLEKTNITAGEEYIQGYKLPKDAWIRANVIFDKIPAVPSRNWLTYDLVTRNVMTMFFGVCCAYFAVWESGYTTVELSIYMIYFIHSYIIAFLYPNLLANIIILLKCKAIEANICLQDVLRTSDTSRLKQIREFHVKLKEIVDDCNEFFGLPMVAYFVLFTVFMCQTITLCLVYYLRESDFSSYVLVFFTIVFIMRTMQTIGIESEGLYSQIDIGRKMLVWCSSQDEEFVKNAEDFKVQMSKKFSFSCMGLFDFGVSGMFLNQQFIMSLATVEAQAAIDEFNNNKNEMNNSTLMANE